MKRKELLGLVIFFLLTVCLRLWRLNYPAQPYFDEIYHLPAVQMMVKGDFETPFEWWHQADWPIYFDWLHPPLAKYFQASLMRACPSLSPVLALRLNSLFFSLLSLLLFYFLVKKMASISLKRNYLSTNSASKIALFSTALLSVDSLFFVTSRIGMNDTVYLFFSLLAVFVFYTYWRQQKLEQLCLLGLVLGLALATKWTALWLIGAVFIWELRRLIVKRSWLELPFLVFSLVLMPLAVYLLSFLPYFLAGKNLSDWWQLQTQIWNFQWHLVQSHPYQSQALTWPLQWQLLPLFQSGRHLILAQINPVYPLFVWLSLVFYLIFPKQRWHLIKHLDPEFYLVLVVFLISFLPWQLVERPLFLYHFLPALPYLILLISRLIYVQALKVNDHQTRVALLFNIIFWPVLVFLMLYPVLTGLSLPKSALTLYFSVLN